MRKNVNASSSCVYSHLQLPDKLNSNDTKLRNNIIQKQFDLYTKKLNSQIKSCLNGGNRIRHDLNESAKRIHDFKKFQFNTELQLHEEHLNELVDDLNHPSRKANPYSNYVNRKQSIRLPRRSQTATLPSKCAKQAEEKLAAKSFINNYHAAYILYQMNQQNASAQSLIDENALGKLKEQLKLELLMRFRLRKSDVDKNQSRIFGLLRNEAKKSSHSNPKRQFSFSVRSQTSLNVEKESEHLTRSCTENQFGAIYSEVKKANTEPNLKQKQPEKTQNDTLEMIQKNLDPKNKKLSVVLLGKSNKHYTIYKFRPNGDFDPNVRQPVLKKIVQAQEDPEIGMKYFKECYRREQSKLSESQIKIQKFCADINKMDSRSATAATSRRKNSLQKIYDSKFI